MISHLQGATMPAAHMLAMTWFKSTHRSWYFSCYAGKFLLILISRSRYIYISILINVTFVNSCQCWILSHRMDRNSRRPKFWTRFALLWSRLYCTMLVLLLWSIRQRHTKVLPARHKCKIKFSLYL